MKTIVLAVSMMVSLPAFAGSSGMSFSDIREACQNPGRFQNQIAPSNLQVTCEERVTRWSPYAAREMDLPCSRQIVTSLTSDKYQVSPTAHAMDVELQKASCPSFKEVLESTSFTKVTSCDELLGFKGGEEEFCADILDKVRQSNPKMVRLEETGRVVEFCSESNVGQQGKGQGQGQGQQGKGQGQGQQGKGQGK